MLANYSYLIKKYITRPAECSLQSPSSTMIYGIIKG